MQILPGFSEGDDPPSVNFFSAGVQIALAGTPVWVHPAKMQGSAADVVAVDYSAPSSLHMSRLLTKRRAELNSSGLFLPPSDPLCGSPHLRDYRADLDPPRGGSDRNGLLKTVWRGTQGVSMLQITQLLPWSPFFLQG